MTKPSTPVPSCPVGTPDSLVSNLSTSLDAKELFTRLSKISGNKAALFGANNIIDLHSETTPAVGILVEGPGNNS